MLAAKQPALQINIDATRMTQAFIGMTYIRSIVMGELNEFVQRYRIETALPVTITTRVKFNPNLNGIWVGGVMEIVSEVTLLSIILTGAALIRERAHGTFEHLLVMPLQSFEIMMAKVWADGLIVLVCAALSLRVIVQGGLGMPIAGSKTLFLVGTLLHLFSTASIGILMATAARSMPQFGLLMILVILPLHCCQEASRHEKACRRLSRPSCWLRQRPISPPQPRRSCIVAPLLRFRASLAAEG